MKPSVRLLLLAVFALISPLALAKSDLFRNALSIGGVPLGASEAQVISAFGDPDSRPALTAEEIAYDSKLVYTDAIAYFIHGRLEYLASSRPGMCTPRKICPGTPVAKVRRKLGCNVSAANPTEESLSCFDTESGCSIVALLHDGKTTGLRLECLP